MYCFKSNLQFISTEIESNFGSLLTGRHPSALGLQHHVILAGQDSGIPRNEQLLPQILKQCGYKNHLVGNQNKINRCWSSVFILN